MLFEFFCASLGSQLGDDSRLLSQLLYLQENLPCRAIRPAWS